MASDGSKGRTPDSSRMSGVCVWDGTRLTPVTELFESPDGRQFPRGMYSPSVVSGGTSRARSRNLGPTTPDAYNWSTTAGKPPSASGRRVEDNHVYKSHAQLGYDKGLCLAHAFHHSNRWERI